MSQRTTITAVQNILGADYGRLPDGTLPDLQQYIDTAVIVIDRLRQRAIAANRTLLPAELELIERWLSAHYYTRTDPTYTSRSTQGASASFTSPGDNPERYLATAMEIDSSGLLEALIKKQNVSAQWLGKTLSERNSYDERN